MRTLAAAALLFAAATVSPPAHAKCTSWNLNSWPEGPDAFPVNGRIVLDEYAQGGRRLFPDGARPPVLSATGGREEIPLDMVEVLPGNFRNRQVVLAPRRALAADTTYVLHLEGSPYPVGPLVFRTSATEDVRAPRWTAAPQWDGEERQRFGCGPSSWAFFTAGVEDDSDVRVRVEIRAADTGEIARFLVAPVDGRLALGHGMCSGGFDFRPGVEYTATFTAVDLAGNETPSPGGSVSFLGPADGARSGPPGR